MNDLVEKRRKSKIFKLTFCILAVVYVLITVILYNTYRNYNYKGQRFKVVTVNDLQGVFIIAGTLWDAE